MKKLLIAFVAMIATLNLFAQEPQPADEPQQAAVQTQNNEHDGLTLKDHKVWLIENGETKTLSEEIWMRNGMQITPSGTIIFANGERAKLREGDFVDMRGAVARPIPIGTDVASK
jgi:hypothetical protein